MRILLSALYPYVFLLLYLTIPFDDYIRALPNILMVILVAVFPFVVKKEDFKRLKGLPVTMLFVFILYLVVSAFFADRLGEDFSTISKVLISLGMVILYIPVNDVQKIKNAIIFSSLAAIVYSVVNFVIITHHLGYFVLGDSPQVVESLLIDRIYLGMLSVFSILISFQGIKKTYNPLNNYYFANIAINLAFILLIASRISLVALLAVLMLHQLYGKKKVWKVAIAAVAGLAIVGLFFMLKNKDSHYFQSDHSPRVVSGFVENSYTYELRATVWECVEQIAKNDKPAWTGLGFENVEEKLVNCYSETISNQDKRESFISERYNSHNQFFDFHLSAGLIGAFLFIIFIASSFYSVKKQFYPTALLLLFVVYCSFENVFHRQIGAYYVGVILLMVLITAGNQEDDIDEKKILE